jgi:hypothetical protein
MHTSSPTPASDRILFYPARRLGVFAGVRAALAAMGCRAELADSLLTMARLENERVLAWPAESTVRPGEPFIVFVSFEAIYGEADVWTAHARDAHLNEDRAWSIARELADAEGEGSEWTVVTGTPICGAVQ